MSKHTPGPWIVIREVKPATGVVYGILPVHADDNKWVARAIADGKSDLDEVEANAHLIAVAPEMLAMLKVIEQYWRKFEVGSGYEANNWPVIKGIIAKAEGRE